MSSQSPGEVALWLPEERPLSWNRYWMGMHWAKRRAEATRVHQVVRSAIDPDAAELFTCRVDIFIQARVNGQRMDPDNLCTKPYVDGLIGWYIEDDDADHVRWVASSCVVAKPRGTMILIRPVPDEDAQARLPVA